MTSHRLLALAASAVAAACVEIRVECGMSSECSGGMVCRVGTCVTDTRDTGDADGEPRSDARPEGLPDGRADGASARDATPGGGADGTNDTALGPDQGPERDAATAFDAARAQDMSPPPDATLAQDISHPPDAARAQDLSHPPDAARAQDMSPPPDATLEPDISPPPVDPPVAAVFDGEGSEFDPSIAAAPGGYVLTWIVDSGRGGRVHAGWLDPQGAPIGPAVPIGDAGAAVSPTVTWAGDEFVVGWLDKPNGDIFSWRGFASAFRIDGTVIETVAFPAPAGPIRVVWTGQQYLAVWDDGTYANWEISLRTFQVGLSAPGPITPIARTASSSFGADVARLDASLGIIWYERSEGGRQIRDIWFSRTDPAAVGEQAAMNLTDTPDDDELGPAIAAGVDGWGVTWRNRTRREVAFATVSAAGERMPIVGLRGGWAGDDSPSVCWNGADYLVFWAEADGIYAAQFSRDGLPTVDPARIADAVRPANLSVSCVRGRAALAWNEPEGDRNRLRVELVGP